MEHARGKHGLEIRNNSGERLCEFCEMNGYAWVSPDGQTKSQIEKERVQDLSGRHKGIQSGSCC